MLSEDEGELTCDFAETYHITDIRALPVPLLATLASGLREDSRIRMKLSGTKITVDQMLQSLVIDRLGRIYWVISGQARAKNPPPESIFDLLRGKKVEEPEDNGLKVFDSPDDFDRRWKEITSGN